MNEMMELLKVIIGTLVGTVGVAFIIKTFFAELSKYREDGIKPFKDSLNKVIEKTGDILNEMMKLFIKENGPKTNDSKTNEYEDYFKNEDGE